jgi:hypothetical protein
MDGWYIGNILFGGLIGILIVDPLTGAMWKLDDVVYGNLSPNHESKATGRVEPESSPTQPKTEDTANRLIQLKELKDAGVLTDHEYEVKRKALADKL